MIFVIISIVSFLLLFFLIYRIFKYKIRKYNRENFGLSLAMLLILLGRIYTNIGEFNLKSLLIGYTFLFSVLLLIFLFGMIRKKNSKQ
ncbi:putative neutral ceramidase superfamily lipid hydrolase [Paenibacillus sp. RC73]